jgi:hypothetical protein
MAYEEDSVRRNSSNSQGAAEAISTVLLCLTRPASPEACVSATCVRLLGPAASGCMAFLGTPKWAMFTHPTPEKAGKKQ